MKKNLPHNTRAILKNIELVFKSADINNLSKPAYNFLCLMSGFIAHYDINGFKSHYTDLRRLINDILQSSDTLNPDREIKDPYFKEQYGEPYCISKVETYKGLRSIAERHKSLISHLESSKQKTYELEIAQRIAERYGFSLTPDPKVSSLAV